MTLSTPIISVSSLDEVKSAVTDAMADKSRLEIIASGSKRALGRQCAYDVTLDLSAMTGIIDYQPEELVLTVRAGTPIAEVQTALAEARQMLAFEVPDYSHLLDTPNAGTIGGRRTTTSRRTSATRPGGSWKHSTMCTRCGWCASAHRLSLHSAPSEATRSALVSPAAALRPLRSSAGGARICALARILDLNAGGRAQAAAPLGRW